MFHLSPQSSCIWRAPRIALMKLSFEAPNHYTSSGTTSTSYSPAPRSWLRRQWRLSTGPSSNLNQKMKKPGCELPTTCGTSLFPPPEVSTLAHPAPSAQADRSSQQRCLRTSFKSTTLLSTARYPHSSYKATTPAKR